MTTPVIYWFRNDLRLSDLPGFNAAVATGQPLIACYVLDDETPREWQAGGASRWWLHHALSALAAELRSLGGTLLIRRGPAQREIPTLAEATGASAVYCSRSYEPWANALEKDLFQQLSSREVALKRYGGTLLFEPDTIANQAGKPFRVFTPFWKTCRRQTPPDAPLPPPAKPVFHPLAGAGLNPEDLALLPRKPNWAAHWSELWQPGSAGAQHSLQRFLKSALDDYDESRNHPDREATSRLSPHLHFGELSPRQLWHAIHQHCAEQPGLEHQRDKFLSELGWREFSHHLMHHFPTMVDQPFKPQYEAFPWIGTADNLLAWQQGRTGYPIIDAGMRELWHTGYMHNRVRMIAASFLTKHLLIPWQAGQRWFWDTLVDADLANNSCGWQWVAGSGADAAPYFRIFNPTLQGTRFDKAGDYVRHWVPELAAMPARYIHEPSTAPAQVLAQAQVVLGDNYPLPIVNHKAARAAALAAYASLKT